jgi:hypothetical protein
MDTPSELLMRSALHDLANVLAGVRGILDLSDPDRPLASRDRLRLEAVLDEGMTTLERSRNLAMETLPGAEVQPGAPWRAELLEQLGPLGILFKCRFDLSYLGDPGLDRWPGELLRGYARAVSRQVLPYVHDGSLAIRCEADRQEWRLIWSPAELLPESLTVEGKQLDISSRWARRVGASLGVALVCEHGALTARIPRF